MDKRIPPEKERLLNPIVGRFNFTAQTKVGTTTELILSKEFKNREEWEAFYYDSGSKKQELEKGAEGTELTKLKKEYGRTEKELEEIGEELYEKVDAFKNITKEDCKRCIKQYVLDNTWVGIIEREKNTARKLEELEIANIQKAPGEVDTGCAVDYEIEINDEKIGIQIKPPSYFGHDKAAIREQNKEKQKKYPGKVFTISSEENGTINNPEVVAEIKAEIERLS